MKTSTKCDTKYLYIYTVVGIITCFFISGCTPDPNKTANELYSKASQCMQSATSEPESHSKAFGFYKSSKSEIDKILSEYSSSNIAVGLLSGQAKITDFSLKEFQQFEKPLKYFADAEQNLFSFAIFVANQGKNVSSKSNSLANIAHDYNQFGEKAEAKNVLALSLEAVNGIKNDPFIAGLLAKIAGEYNKSGEKEKALQILSQALEVARSINFNPRFRDEELGKIAEKYAETGGFIQAIEITKEIKFIFQKAQVLAQIAGEYLTILEKEKAEELLIQSLEIITTANNKDHYNDPDILPVLKTIAGQYAKAKQFDQALKINRMMEGYPADDGFDSRIVETIETISKEYANAGLLGQALELAMTVNKGGWFHGIQVDLLEVIAGQHIKAGETKQALTILSKIYETTLLTKESDFRPLPLAKIAYRQIQLGEKEKADTIFNQSLENALKIQNPDHKARTLAEIAYLYALGGAKEKASQTISLALKIAMDKTPDEYTLQEIAVKYASAGIKPSEKDIAVLSEYVNKTNPMKLFFSSLSAEKKAVISSNNVALIVDSKSPSNQIAAAKNGQSLTESDQLGGAKGNVVNVLTGQPIAGAQVISTTSTNIESEQRYKQVITKTALDGSFVVEGLRNKAYRIAITKEGFFDAESYAEIPAKSNVLINKPIDLLPAVTQGPGIYAYIDKFVKLTQSVPYSDENPGRRRIITKISFDGNDLKDVYAMNPKYLLLYGPNKGLDYMYLLFKQQNDTYELGPYFDQAAVNLGHVKLSRGCTNDKPEFLKYENHQNPLHFLGTFKCAYSNNRDIHVFEVSNIPEGYYFISTSNAYDMQDHPDSLILNYRTANNKQSNF